MSLKVLADECIGCGGCEFACPTGALTKTDSFLGLFAIDPYRCDDCGKCVPKCPVDAIVTAEGWPTCFGHGCPLSSARLQGTECNIWQEACPTCGGPLWRAVDGAAWRCPRCDEDRKVGCPKLRHLTGTATTALA
jgi:ferredoxin